MELKILPLEKKESGCAARRKSREVIKIFRENKLHCDPFNLDHKKNLKAEEFSDAHANKKNLLNFTICKGVGGR